MAILSPITVMYLGRNTMKLLAHEIVLCACKILFDATCPMTCTQKRNVDKAYESI
jgi:hypothetical protein